MAPGRGRGRLFWWPLIFKKNFLISFLSDMSVLMNYLTDSSMAIPYIIQSFIRYIRIAGPGRFFFTEAGQNGRGAELKIIN
jgi:hypothetical protein